MLLNSKQELLDRTSGENVHEIKPKRLKRTIIASTFLMLFVLLMFWAFYNGLVVKEYDVVSHKMPGNTKVRIAVIADLHSHIYGKEQEPIADIIRTQKPDLIALVGDIADDEEPIIGTELFLLKIKDVAPIYYVTGNHEFWSNNVDSTLKLFDNYGVKVLQNESQNITINGVDLTICGIDDPEVFKYTENEELLNMACDDEVLERFSDLNTSRVNILLAHRPERIESYKKYDFDLVLSGHSHGGQFRIPLLLNGLYAPNQGFFPKYSGGLYKHRDLTHIVSRGLSYNPRLPRIFNPPEIVIVEVKGQ